MTPKAQATKASKWCSIKLKTFYTARETVNKMAGYRMGKNVCKPFI
jgi:hypothetical protein